MDENRSCQEFCGLEPFSVKRRGPHVIAITYDRNMALSLKGEHLKRYRDIAALFLKYGRGDLVSGAGATLEARWSTWERVAWHADSEYAVSVHRLR